MRTSALLIAIMLVAPTLGAAQRAQPRQQQGQAQGQAAQPGTPPAAPRPGADEYTQRVQQGIARITSGDAAGASEAFREAVEMDRARPAAVYYLAAVQRMGGNLQEALTGFQAAVGVARTANDPRWIARALQGVAETLERMEGRTEEALAAWQEYVRHADAAQAVSDPQLGRARIQAVNVMMEQERVYVQVRQRIAEREQERQREEQQQRQRRR